MVKRSYVILTNEQEIILVYRFIRKRCIWSFYKLMRFYVRVIFKVSHKFHNSNVYFSDVFNEGLVGLVNAILLFNPEKNCKLVNFVYLWVNFYILNYIKKRMLVSTRSVLFDFNKNNNTCEFITVPYVRKYFNDIYDDYYKLYKISSALYYLFPILQVIIFSSYIFRRPISLEELSFFLNISIETIRRLKKIILDVVHILSL